MMMDILVDVECVSGYKYPERPDFVKFGERFKVIKIIDNWRSPEGEFFKVELSNYKHKKLILTVYYNTKKKNWMLRL